MVSKREVLVALIIGSIIGGTASATILDAASASQARHERSETAQTAPHQAPAASENYGPASSAT
jgi:type II secretory pathway component PulJ